ncbi:Gliding motility regulatory protein [Pelotomaculum schinkii]|uniref:Stage 0 sporulation protein A homolog n=1 Tax=Pelotomaculum schinkii TaxID=78350 RepID=A0A4Y7RFZ1_9FIRM|nr:response regulator [Pelotomaculum schinkii]TEB07247.1 Gliding motility regulatory protein [Pelotomaculum schinkii]
MGKKDEDLLIRLRTMFKVEAGERLKAITSGLMELEKELSSDTQAKIIETVFREAHSLKGAARAVNMQEIETVCQSLEGALARLKHGKIMLSSNLLNIFHQAVDTVGMLLFSPDKNPGEAEVLLKQLESLESCKDVSSTGYQSCTSSEIKEGHKPQTDPAGCPQVKTCHEIPAEDTPGKMNSSGSVKGISGKSMAPVQEIPPSTETVRIATSKLDSLLLQIEELLSVKLAAKQSAENLLDFKAGIDLWEREGAKIQPELLLLRKYLENAGKPIEMKQAGLLLAKVLDFIDWNYAFAKSLQNKFNEQVKTAEADRLTLDGKVNTLLEDMKKALMLPFSTVLETYPKMVRDLTSREGKEVDLQLHGKEVEIDKRILEEIKDPLIHLVRNCVDHGIEKPDIRELSQKPRRGRITIAVTQVEGTKVEIAVTDDGAGIHVEKVIEAAVKRGVITHKQAENIGVQESLALIFKSEVSTNQIVTEISGRGLGLAIAQEKVNKLRGSMSVETSPGNGTSIRILLPVTLTALRGIMIRAAGQIFALPTSNVERVVRTRRDQIKTVENMKTVLVDGRVISLVGLSDVLGLDGENNEDEKSDYIRLLILCYAGKSIAFQVDEILKEQEILLKSLGKPLLRVRNIAGATILGSGKVIPVLNVSDLIKSAVNINAKTSAMTVSTQENKPKKRSVLVVEDSITARVLLKNILESSGYRVKTAVDGIDAYTNLRTGQFDLVVSDIEMPRMNGFDLTAKIRSDDQLSHLPVVLVTGLESREDRERGIDVGANAYIAKSSFDHSNLLETIQKII